MTSVLHYKYQTEKFEGTTVTGSRWLARLDGGMEANNLSSPCDFFKAINILFEDKAAIWLDSSVRWAPIIGAPATATQADVTNFRKALIIQFKGASRPTLLDTSVQADIRNLSQGSTESFASYYQRALDLISRSQCRDEPLPNSGEDPLSGIEINYLSMIVTAFVEGLQSQDIRRDLVYRDGGSFSSLYKAYKAALNAQESINRLQDMESRAAEKAELENLRAMMHQGRPVAAMFAGQHDPRAIPRSYQMEARKQDVSYNAGQNYQFEGARPNYTPQYAPKNAPNESRIPRPNGPRTSNSDSKVLPPKTLSRIPYINGAIVWNKSLGPLCVRCGNIGHGAKGCLEANNLPAERWEQAYLKDLVFGMDAQSCMLLDEIRSEKPSSKVTSPHTIQLPNPLPKAENIPRITLDQFDMLRSLPRQNISDFAGMSATLDIDRRSPHSETSIELDAFLNEGESASTPQFSQPEGAPRKRKATTVEDLLNSDEEPPTKAAKKAHKRGQRVLRHLREIVGRFGMGPIDYKKLAESINVNISLLELFQMSPDCSKALRRLSTPLTPKMVKKMAAEKSNTFQSGAHANSVQINASSNTSDKLLKHIVPTSNKEEKAFRVPATIRTGKTGSTVDIDLPSGAAQADTGSEMVVITVGLVRRLGLPMLQLSERGFSGLKMNVADGTSAKLAYYTRFNVGVLGIWRQIEAFVRPWTSENLNDQHLLLGHTWLHAVNAKLFIRDSIIEIGDPAAGEQVHKIRGPEFVQSNHHSLILYPKLPKENPIALPRYLEDSSDESDDSDGDSDSSDDDPEN